MVRWTVGIGYFPFFFEVRDLVRAPVDFFAAFAGDFFAAAFALGAAFAAFFAGDFAFVAREGAECLASAASRSASGVSGWPIASDSISTTSDQSRWYVETSAYGITWTVGRLRPLRNTFGFEPFVRISTFCSATPSLSTSALRRDVFGESYSKRSMMKI